MVWVWGEERGKVRAGRKNTAFTALTHTHTHIREIRKERLVLNSPNILYDMGVKLLKKKFFFQEI